MVIFFFFLFFSIPGSGCSVTSRSMACICHKLQLTGRPGELSWRAKGKEGQTINRRSNGETLWLKIGSRRQPCHVDIEVEVEVELERAGLKEAKS